VNPRKHYKSVGKYLRAVERAVLVTSTWEMFPPLSTAEEEYSVNPASASSSSLRDATTPIFSPIPFLHDDARSRSPSPMSIPPPTQRNAPSPETRALGLVDELDNPKPGHLSDHPKPLSAVTDLSAVAPLKERFVASDADKENKESTEGTKDLEKPNGSQAAVKEKEEEKEEEAMVVDTPPVEEINK
jgi:serine/threonine-protein phosphatase 4 regulatory subunit 2